MLGRVTTMLKLSLTKFIHSILLILRGLIPYETRIMEPAL